MTNEQYLECIIVQLHDDCLGRAHPALHVDKWSTSPVHGRRFVLLLAVASFGQILVHVLGEIAKESQPFHQVGWKSVEAVAARFTGRVLEVQAAVSHTIGRLLNECQSNFMCWGGTTNLLPVVGVAYPRAVIEEDAHSSVRQLETEAIFVRIVDPFGNEERITRHRARVRRGCNTIIQMKMPFKTWQDW